MPSTLSPFPDQVILIDETDHQIGVMDKIEAHRGNGYRHRAASVYLFNDRGELLIQQRSDLKIVGAGQWANTCCGNVWPNESYEECAQRRLEKELGIVGVSLTLLSNFPYHQQCNPEFSEWEMVHVFGGQYNNQPAPNPAEVSDTHWVNWRELVEKLGQGEPGEFGEVELELDGITYTFAPWFVLMIKDQTLRAALEKLLINN